MAYETIGGSTGSGEKPEKTIYYTYKMPEDGVLKENQKWLKKGEFVEGYYLNSYVPPKAKYKTHNHVLVSEDNTHHVLPGGKDIDKTFLSDRCEEAVKTKYTYLGKTKFTYTNEDGTEGEAMAMKCLLEQDKTDRVKFIGDKYSAKVTANDSTPSEKVKADASFQADDIPF